MKRFQQLTQSITGVIGLQRYGIGIELGSSTARLVFNGQFAVEQPSIAIEHASMGSVHTSSLPVSMRPDMKVNKQGRSSLQSTSQFHHPLLHTMPLVQNGVVTQVKAARTMIQSMVAELSEQPDFMHQYQGWCVVPSGATPLELEIINASLPVPVGLEWRLIPKGLLHQLSAVKRFSDTGMTAIIDIGADITEVSISQNAIQNVDYNRVQSMWPEAQRLSQTLYWGTRDLERQLQMVIRDQYQVQLSSEAFRSLYTQLGDTLFSATVESKAKFAVRAQSLATGRPVTVTLHARELQPAFIEWFDYLTTGLSVLFQRYQAPWLANTLEQGVIVVGGGAAIADVVPALAEFLSVPTTSVPQPRNWTVTGLEILTKQVT